MKSAYEILRENNINIFKLDHCIFMDDEQPYTDKDIKLFKEKALAYAIFVAYNGDWKLNPEVLIINAGKYNEYVKKHTFENIHGKHRKIVKYSYKRNLKELDTYIKLHNKYCGMDGIICAYAQLGYSTWWAEDIVFFDYFSKTWYKDGCIDPFNSAYSYIYIQI